MKETVFSPSFVENRGKALGLSSFISISFHGALFLAIGFTLPVISLEPPRNQSIDIDLTILDARPGKFDEPVAGDRPGGQTLEETPASPESPQIQASSEFKVSEPKKTYPSKKKQQKAENQRKKTVNKSLSASSIDTLSRQASANPESSRKMTNNADILSSPEDFSGPSPGYPELARKRNQEGTVHVRCKIDSNGAVVKTNINKSSGFKLLDDAALKAVSKWKYHFSGGAGEMKPKFIIVPVKFKLK